MNNVGDGEVAWMTFVAYVLSSLSVHDQVY